MSEQERIGFVLESTQNNIVVGLDGFEVFDRNKENLQIGKYIKIQDGNHRFILACILNVRAIKKVEQNEVESENSFEGYKFQIDTQPIGTIEEEFFQRGNTCLPVPTESVFLVTESDLMSVFETYGEHNFTFGKLTQNNNIDLKIDGDKFFGKHVGIVGSTGAGKSCTVAKLLQQCVGINNGQNVFKEQQKNSHIIIFDIHAEYNAAFKLSQEQGFNLNKLNVSNLILPYWLMNSEELEAMFIESNEANSHNQISQFRNAVVLNKQRYNQNVKDIAFDTPVYFNIQEVCNYIENLNNEVVSKNPGEHTPKILLHDNTTRLITNREEYFNELFEFVPQSNTKDNKASGGPFKGEFDRFIMRLQNKINDKRLSFIINNKKEDSSNYTTDDFELIIKQFLGYVNKANVSIVDLSGIPFEVLNISVSLISRLVFDFCFHYSKIQHEKERLNEIPVLIVCEEAHIYIPKENGSQYKASKKSLERIAKEGRKYGLSLMVVSQRPSEVSDTIFAQCNNFISLRLTNYNDQNYVKRLMPDTTNGIADVLPNLAPGEFVIVGDAVIMPSIAKAERPNPEPESKNVNFHTEWQTDWKEVEFTNVISRWRKEIYEEKVKVEVTN
ncbi:ATP-binding protein [Bacillus anthracis]|uniref:ATP-binding protein n=1 Tax=Bacillus cereus group TaxID=86661 RepID=UPI003BA084B8